MKFGLKKRNMNMKLPSYEALYKILMIVAVLLVIIFIGLMIFKTYNQTAHGNQEFFENDISPGVYELIYVYSERCPHCVKFSPVMEAATKQLMMEPYTNKLKIEKFESKEEGAKKYLDMMDGFPTLLLFNPQGELVEGLVGARTLEEVMSFATQKMQSTKS